MKFIEKLSREQQQVKKFLEVFFSASVNFIKSDLEEIYKETGVDVLSKKKRITYKISDNKHLIIVFHHSEDKKRNKDILYKILITSDLCSKIPDSYYESTSIVVSEFFNYERNGTFINLYNFCSIDILSKTLVSYMISTAAFNKNRVYSRLEKLEKLSSTTFEGESFSTGFILTRRMKDILASSDPNYNCTPFFDSFPIVDFKNDYKRNWYIVDGKTSYFILDQKSEISYILHIKEEDDFYKNYFLSNFLKGQDLVFRSYGHGELSIINNEGIEITKRENEWKIRSLSSFVDFFMSSCEMEENVSRYLCFYILECSRNHHSSIFWIPKRDLKPDIFDTLIAAKNDLQCNKINITNSEMKSFLMRIFTSDGASVINPDGYLQYCGAIVRTQCDDKNGMMGTGETAASNLGRFGVCVKISQDGKIKIFKDDEKTVF